MACASSLLSEDKFLCSVCLEVFTDPVSTPCGHNFCSSCIKTYWDSADFCQCPLCNQKFYPRPQLQVNTVMSELAADFKALVQIKESTPDPQVPDLPETTGVLCDYCTDMKREAVKSCLSCLISYCDVHLEPHRRVKVLKGHTLSGPLKSLENRMCSIHSKIEDLYCRTDQTCVCVVCIKNSHKSHDVVPLKEEYEALRVKRDETKENIRKMIESRSKKVSEIENSLDVCEKEAKKEEEASVQAFTDLICCLQERQSELVEAIEERYRATRQRAEGFLSELKMEIAELENRSRKLKELTQSKDHHHFLQSFPMLCSPLSSDWIKFKVHSDLSFEGVRRTLIPLKQKADRITENLPEITMKRMREHAVDLTFDPDTAYCTLVISQDGKKVMDSGKDQNYTPKPKRFESSEEVLAKQHLTGISYYEVQVKGIRGWLLGVARESVDTQTSEYQSVQLGYWTIGLLDGTYYSFSSPKSPIKVKEKLEKVGIFVDYNRGVVSFYDVNYKSHIYSFLNCNFKRKLYPYFCLSDSLVGVPLIITPVP